MDSKQLHAVSIYILFFGIGILCSCQRTREPVNLDGFIEEYNLWVNISTYQTSGNTIKAIRVGSEKLKNAISPVCKITYVVDKQISKLSVEEFIEEIQKQSFMTLAQQVMLRCPETIEKDEKAFVKMIRGFSSQREFQIAECELVIDISSGSYAITEIRRLYREPTTEEIQLIQTLLNDRPYDPRKGLGARYLGGGDFSGKVSFSPDGKQVVFTGLRHESSDIYIMNIDGSGERRLTHTPFWEISPKFTPDGQNIIFFSDQDSYDGEPYLMNLGDGKIRRLLPQFNHVTDICYSRDGTLMSFVANGDNGSQVYIDGGGTEGVYPLTDNDKEKHSTIFSADGSNIYFTQKWYDYSKSPPLCVEIFSVNSNGSGLRQLTHDREPKHTFATTLKNEVLFIKSNASYDNEMWVMDSTGGNGEHIVGGNSNGIFCAILSPDEKHVLYSNDANTAYEYEIFAINLAEAKSVKQITHENGYLSSIDVSQDGKHVVYLAQPKGTPQRGKGKICIVSIQGGTPICISKM